MFTVTVTKRAGRDGSGRAVATCNGRQRTTKWDLSKSDRHNFGAAAGTLLDVLLDSRQQAMVRHPSGAQRVSMDYLTEYGGKVRFTVDV